MIRFPGWYVRGPARGGKETHDGAIADLDRAVKLNPREKEEVTIDNAAASGMSPDATDQSSSDSSSGSSG
jgi:hypothetical protein